MRQPTKLALPSSTSVASGHTIFRSGSCQLYWHEVTHHLEWLGLAVRTVPIKPIQGYKPIHECQCRLCVQQERLLELRFHPINFANDETIILFCSRKFPHLCYTEILLFEGPVSNTKQSLSILWRRDAFLRCHSTPTFISK